MNVQILNAAPSNDTPDQLPIDSAISHCEKLRRVLELEEWIRDACADPILAAPCRTWRAERENLLVELQLTN
jgi:hypothetical protein